jgi:hypothetical protein
LVSKSKESRWRGCPPSIVSKSREWGGDVFHRVEIEGKGGGGKPVLLASVHWGSETAHREKIEAGVPYTPTTHVSFLPSLSPLRCCCMLVDCREFAFGGCLRREEELGRARFGTHRGNQCIFTSRLDNLFVEEGE